MAINNSGVTAARIPYTPNSGRPPSKYISGLIDYVQRRMGKSEKEAKSIAFAIASKHKKEGMPTKTSARFSKTGKRTGFIEQALDKNSAKFIELIENAITFSVEATIESYYKSILNR
jgi:exonuclease V gamma subunit